MEPLTVIDFTESSTCDITSNNRYGFIRTCVEAYTNHKGIVISPDNIWVAILSQVSLYFKHNGESIRRKYVDFDGKVLLTLQYGNLNENHESIINDLSDQVSSIIKDKEFFDWVTVDFSTSTSISQLVKKIMILGIFDSYFEYMVTECGLSKIIIKGTMIDWIKLYKSLDKLRDFDYVGNQYNINKWITNLKTFVTKFINVKGAEKIDVNFWRNFVSDSNRSGGPYIYGHILALTEFYEENGKLRQMEDTNKCLPIHLISESVSINIRSNLGHIYSIRAGNLGFDIKDENLNPTIGYMIKKKPGYSLFDNRLESFKNWNAITDRVLLAKAGFYYLNSGDKVKCFRCGIVLCNWKDDDVPIYEHKRYSPSCNFILKNRYTSMT